MRAYGVPRGVGDLDAIQFAGSSIDSGACTGRQPAQPVVHRTAITGAIGGDQPGVGQKCGVCVTWFAVALNAALVTGALACRGLDGAADHLAEVAGTTVSVALEGGTVAPGQDGGEQFPHGIGVPRFIQRVADVV